MKPVWCSNCKRGMLTKAKSEESFEKAKRQEIGLEIKCGKCGHLNSL